MNFVIMLFVVTETKQRSNIEPAPLSEVLKVIPDTIYILGSGRTLRTAVAGKNRLRTSSYVGLYTNREINPIASGVRARVLAAATVERAMPGRDFVTMGYRVPIEQEVVQNEAYSGNPSSAAVMAEELAKTAKIPKETIVTLERPTSTITELMEIVQHQVTTAHSGTNGMIVTNDYQVDRVQEFLSAIQSSIGRTWLYRAQFASLTAEDSLYRQCFNQLWQQFEKQVAMVQKKEVQTTVTSAERILTFRSKWHKKLVRDLPNWQTVSSERPWINSAKPETTGNIAVLLRWYRFSPDSLKTYIENCYPSTFLKDRQNLM